MGEKNISDILIQLSGMYLVIEELNEAIPGVKADFQNNVAISKEINRLSNKAEELLKEVTSKGIQVSKDAEDIIKRIHDENKRAEKVNEEINKKLDGLPNIKSYLKELEELSERVDDLEMYYDQKIEEIEIRIKKLDSEEISGNDNGYDRYAWYSIEELLDFEELGELLVFRKSWHGDFCFLVKEISRGYAYGTQYKEGIEHKDTRYGIHVEEFQLYEGPSKNLILDQI